MSATGTYRGTPKNKHQQHAQFTNSPSGIPRPALDQHTSQSDAGTSNLSASRQKMSKRDEVGVLGFFARKAEPILTKTIGYPAQDRDGSEQEEEPGRPRPPDEKGPSWHRPRPEAQPGAANQA